MSGYQFIGTTANDAFGKSVSSAGDVDGDGLDDLIIGAPDAVGGIFYSGEAYLITGADLAAADAADGTVDGVIDVDNINEQSTSYQFLGGPVFNGNAGASVTSAGDIDGDGLDDLLITASIPSGIASTTHSVTYLVSSADLAAADAADGTVDGVISLDNVSAQSSSYQINGVSFLSSYSSIAAAGDVNGDGIADFIIGEPSAFTSANGAGGSYLISGADLAAADAADGLVDGVIGLDNVSAQSTSYQFNGASSGVNSGISVSSAGDVDGDGQDDLLIGANKGISGGTQSGGAFLINSTDLAAADAADGTVDGIIDLGNVSAQSTSYEFVGGSLFDRAGAAVSSAGDVDGDGLADLLIGVTGDDTGGQDAGGAYLITGADLALADAADGVVDGVIDLDNVNAQSTSYQFIGGAAYDSAGVSVASAGDVDGDGLADLIIGAIDADGGGFGSGEAYLMTAADLAAADAADGTVDGVIDLYNVNEQSTSYQFVGTEISDGAGVSVSSAGDVDGDGLDDILIGAYLADGGGVDSGESYLITAANLVAADAEDGTIDGVIDLGNLYQPSIPSVSYQFNGTEAGDVAGYSVSSAGDIDGDGLDDLIIGAPRADGGGVDSGESYLVSAAGLAAADAADGTVDGVIDLDNINEQSASYQFIGTELGDNAGYSVSSAGDVDGDGLDDLIIGAYHADGGGKNSGESYLITGADLAAADAADGMVDGVIDLDNINEQSTSYQFIGTEAGDAAGFSVSSAGDVDGDGLDDLIIGSFTADGGGANSGESYLISGADLLAADGADGLVDGVIDLDNVNEQATSYQFIGTEAGDGSGYSVASAGDIDNDGLDDLIIGAPNADGGGSNSGESYLILGADLVAADGADGLVDGVIDLDNVNEQTGSYQFIGTQAADFAGLSVASAGDVDGDGADDLIIGALFADGGGLNSGEGYLLTSADLVAADAADGLVDGVIDLDNINEQSASYQFIGTQAGDLTGRSFASAGDVDGDGLADLIIGANRGDGGGTNSGESFLIMGVDLAAADAADGAIDGVIDLDNINEQSASYQIVGAQAGDGFGWSVSSAGDVDGDGLADILIGANNADGGGVDSGASYLLTAANLAGADAADGTVDGVIHIDSLWCFVAGTQVLTPSGEVPIEDLEVGQMVITKDRGPQPVRWIGTSTRQAKGALAPIRFRKDSIGNHRDLLVSPQHRMLVSGWQAELLFGEDELLVSAVSLVNDNTIARVEGGEVSYIHLLFDQHEIVFAQGAPSESFHPGEADLSTMAPAAKAEILRLFPELEMQDEDSYGGSVRSVLSPHEACLLQIR